MSVASGDGDQQSGDADLFGKSARRAEPPPKPADQLKGHRARLRARFLSGGRAALADYELLEIYLFRAIPRRDVKPLAKRLLERFGDFAGVVSAEPERLREIDGLGEAAIIDLKILEAAVLEVKRGRATARLALNSGDAVIDYLRLALGHRATEAFHVLFLDKKNQLIRDERLGEGTVDEVAIYPREIVKRALELGASSLILVHNHPSGDCAPSRADIEMTGRVKEAAALFDVALLDHFIVSPEDWTSFRGRSLL